MAGRGITLLQGTGTVPTTGLLAWDGDSIMWGQNVSETVTIDIVAQNTINLTSPYSVNLGVGGELMATMSTLAAARVDTLLASHANHPRICIMQGGCNDINALTTGANLFNNTLVPYIAARRAAGYDAMVIGTLLPRSSTNNSYETERQAYNALVRTLASNTIAIADVGADATIGVAGANSDQTYYSADAIHQKNAGAAIAAPIYATAINNVLSTYQITGLARVRRTAICISHNSSDTMLPRQVG